MRMSLAIQIEHSLTSAWGILYWTTLQFHIVSMDSWIIEWNVFQIESEVTIHPHDVNRAPDEDESMFQIKHLLGKSKSG